MDEEQAVKGNAGDRKRKRVLVVDDDTIVHVERRRSKWVPITITSLLALTLMLLSAGLGAWMNSNASPPSEAQRFEDAAKLLGIPLNEKSLAGITFVSSNGPRSSMSFTHKCLNCGYEGLAVTLQYPNDPGVGWWAHDKKDVMEVLGMTPTASAQEAQ